MPALIRKHGGKVLAKSPAQTLEGDDRLPGTVVMIEFPTAAAARSWYDDPAHARLKQLRRAGSDFDLPLADGLQPARRAAGRIRTRRPNGSTRPTSSGRSLR